MLDNNGETKKKEARHSITATVSFFKSQHNYMAGGVKCL